MKFLNVTQCPVQYRQWRRIFKLQPWSVGLWVSHEAVAGHEVVHVDSRVNPAEESMGETCAVRVTIDASHT